ncbi:SMP-30/gluconolactonase/LRE family protein [Gemmatimonadota bacterium]
MFKMARLLVCSIILLSTGACSQQQSDDAPEAGDVAHRSEVAFQLAERDLVPEGICYDPVSEAFFLGSIQKHKILRISIDGDVETFVPPRFEGLWSVIGMRVDSERRVLWANSDQGNLVDDADPEAPKVTGVYKFDADDGTLIKKYLIPKKDTDHLFNDVAITADGSVYLTSYSGGMVYRIDSHTDTLEEFLSMPEDIWNNGIDISPDGRFLFVVGNEHIFRVDVASREMIQMPIPNGDFVGYGDGLYFREHSLISIAGWRLDGQLVNRVLQLHLSDEMNEITQIEVLDQNHPLYSAPTTGAIVGDWFYYIATSHLDKIDEDGNLAPWEELSDTYILKLPLN